ncbi:MAG: sulfatase-like hydrolase/transferase [Mangrovicoccus sp.]
MSVTTSQSSDTEIAAQINNEYTSIDFGNDGVFEQKNIVMVSVDDLFNVVRFRDTFGVSIQTPNIDRLLGLGTYFDAAHALKPACNPSRASTMTSLSHFKTGVINNNDNFAEFLNPGETLPGLLQSAGYYTAGVGKLFHGGLAASDTTSAKAQFLASAFDHYQVDTGNSISQTSSIESRHGAGNLTEDQIADTNAAIWAADFVSSYSGDSPYFLALGLKKPHLDWNVPQAYYDLYDPSQIVPPPTPDTDYDDVPLFFQQFWSPNYHDKVVAADEWVNGIHSYLAAISYADAQLGRLLDAMDAANAWDDTTFVLWSDHGYHLGDKEHWGKFTHWEQATNAPLIIVDPDHGSAGSTVTAPVSLLDIMPTLLDLAETGVTTGPIDGQSLLELVQDPTTNWASPAVSVFDGSISLRTATHRYILGLTGDEQLYDMVNDPEQFTNLASDPGQAALLSQLRDMAAHEATLLGAITDFNATELSGSAAGEHLFVTPNIERAYGSVGDDVYAVFDPNQISAIRELAGNGTDVIRFYGAGTGVIETPTIRLPYAVENLIVERDVAPIVHGNGNHNYLKSGRHASELYGWAGNDTLQGHWGKDRLVGHIGNDVLKGHTNDDTLLGLSGRDLLEGGDGRDDLRGGTENDTLRGGAHDDTLRGGWQNDFLSGGTGNDLMYGEQNNDRMNGDQGNDTLYGNDGADFMTGYHGADYMDGGRHNDVLKGGNDNDTLMGGEGHDLLQGGWQNDSLIGGAGRDSLYGDQNNDSLYGGSENDLLNGGDGHDSLWGEAGNDSLIGGRHHDWLSGGSGNDTLSGGSGKDTLWGGSGDDWLEGGTARDLFYFDLTQIDGAGHDSIAGFSTQEDLIQLVSPSLNSRADLVWSLSGSGHLLLSDAHMSFSVEFLNLNLSAAALVDVHFV